MENVEKNENLTKENLMKFRWKYTIIWSIRKFLGQREQNRIDFQQQTGSRKKQVQSREYSVYVQMNREGQCVNS